MRTRRQILDSLESNYVQALQAAQERGDEAEASRLELDFVRDQLQLEVLLDLRALLSPPAEAATAVDPADASGGTRVQGILDTAAKIRNLTRLR